MKRQFWLVGILLLGLACALNAQGQGTVTSFYFGKSLGTDILMFESTVRFESRAPLGAVMGLIPGLKGKLDIWLDSIMLVKDTAERAGARAGGMMPPSGYQAPVGKLEFPLQNLVTGQSSRDAALKSDKFFNATQYPTVTFTILGIESPTAYKLSDGREVGMTVRGDLTLNGQTKRLANVKAFMTYIKQQPLTESNLKLQGDLVHFTAELSFRLSDFGIAIPTQDLLTMNDAMKFTIDAVGTTTP